MGFRSSRGTMASDAPSWSPLCPELSRPWACCSWHGDGNRQPSYTPNSTQYAAPATNQCATYSTIFVLRSVNEIMNVAKHESHENFGM